jgi:hypothetical protein
MRMFGAILAAIFSAAIVLIATGFVVCYIALAAGSATIAILGGIFGIVLAFIVGNYVARAVLND